MSIGKVKYIEREAHWVSGVSYENTHSYSWFTLLPGKHYEIYTIYGYLPIRFTLAGSRLK